MIMAFLKKVPAGMMIVPMFLSSIVNSFFPSILDIGSFTTAVFTKAGIAAVLGVQLICMGSQLRYKELPSVIKRGGVLLIAKYTIAIIIGLIVGKIFGMAGIFGLTTLAIVAAVSDSNGSMYLALNAEYGDEVDQATMSLLAVNDGPFLTLLALGASGMANVPFVALLAVIVPILFGMILGNLDKEMSKFLAPGVSILLPFVGITLGASIDINGILTGGLSGIMLGLVVVCISGPFVVFCDRMFNKRPGYAGWAVSSTTGNAIAIPFAVSLVDPAWAPYAELATTQVAASTVFTAICIPIITSFWAKKYGCPKYPLPHQDFSKKEYNK